MTRAIDLSGFSPGTLEQLIHTLKGRTEEFGHPQAMSDLKAELDERYTRIEEEVPGWHR